MKTKPLPTSPCPQEELGVKALCFIVCEREPPKRTQRENENDIHAIALNG